MKSKLAALMIVVFALAACNRSQNNVSTELIEIDIAGGVEKTVPLKASDLGKSIRYIPLETTDESLIARNPTVKVFNDKIVITVSKQCLLFDKNSGKFLGEIGHVGDDPEGYSNPTCWIDDENEHLYFKRHPAGLVKYNTNGEFLGKITIPTPPDSPSEFVFSDSIITGSYNNYLESDIRAIMHFNGNGELIDTIPAVSTSLNVTTNGIKDISVLKNKAALGMSGSLGLIVINTHNDLSIYTLLGIQTLWKDNEAIRYRKFFNDTIYAVVQDELKPHTVFNTGKWHWPAEERFDMDISGKKLIISQILETPRSIYFECIRNLYDNENAEYYKGIYSKDSKTTKISQGKIDIEDDLTDFIHLQPTTFSNTGEYVGLLQVDDILNWLEENPDAEYTGSLSFLKNANEDMNPVVVLIE